YNEEESRAPRALLCRWFRRGDTLLWDAMRRQSKRKRVVSLIGRLRRSAKRPPWQGPGAFAVVQHQLAVDDHLLHTYSQTPTVVIGGPVADRRGIEHDDVCRHPLTKQAAVLQAETA